LPERRGVDISVVVPLRDEEANVEPLHRELSGVLRTLGRPYEIVLIDDGYQFVPHGLGGFVEQNQPGTGGRHHIADPQ